MGAAASHSGEPLDGYFLSSLGQRHRILGHDFSKIRIHTDDTAHEAADRLSARAFTVGSDIFFRRGEYRPAEPLGHSLLLHELTHVAQDPATPISEAWRLPLSTPGDASERAASEVAEGRLRHGGRVSPTAPAIRRVLAAYSSSHTDILPNNNGSAMVPTVTLAADSARVRAALAALITARKIEVTSVGDKDFFSLPATGAATSAEVLSALLAAGFPKAMDMLAALMDRHNARLYSHEEVYELQGLWTQTVSRTPEVVHQTERPLTSEETGEAKLVFGPGLDYSAVRITEDPVVSVGGYARTLPSGVNFPVGASTGRGYMPWLIHELTHSWQYQHGRSVVATGTRATLVGIGLSSQSYGGKPALAAATAAGKGLSSFNTEQQGQIAHDYYVDFKAKAGVAEYAPFLAEFRTPP